MKKLLFILGLLLIVGSVSAWTIESENYSGTIEFYDNGVGTAFIDGYPVTSFSWNWVGGTDYEARWMWYRVDFTYQDGVITSPRFPGARLV